MVKPYWVRELLVVYCQLCTSQIVNVDTSGSRECRESQLLTQGKIQFSSFRSGSCFTVISVVIVVTVSYLLK